MLCALVDDYGLLQALSRSLVESDAAEDPNMKIRLFNVYREIACQLVIDELTPLRPTQPDEVALYILFGFEKMGMSILKELAEYAHFENQKRARVLVLSTNARQDMLHCLAQVGTPQPRFSSHCAVERRVRCAHGRVGFAAGQARPRC